MSAGISTTSTTYVPTYESILSAMAAMQESLGPDPFQKFMLDRECPPNKGWVLVMPASFYDMLKDRVGSDLPSYFLRSPVAGTMMMCNPEAIGISMPKSLTDFGST